MSVTDGMADPISIAAGVLGLLGTCVKVGSTLKDFYDGAVIADTKVKGLLADVETFTQVLRLMKDTFEQEHIQTSFQATGHIGNHWKTLSASIQDGQNTLLQLQETLEKVNKSVSVLDGARKHLRFKGALEEIGIFQLQIRSYRDTLQLSMQTVILWNQVTLKESTDKILPNLDELNQAIRRIALDINNRMSSLQNVVESNASEVQLLALNNLRNCVQTAASVVSSASTTLGVEHTDHFSVNYGSDFGDCFPSERGETMLRWISSNTVYEFEDGPAAESSSRRHNLTSNSHQSVEEDPEPEHSDSDIDLEVEVFQAIMKRGIERFQAKDYGAAERLLRNCLNRTSSNLSIVSLHILRSKSEIMDLLLRVYLFEEKWDEAQSLLLEKIALGSRDNSGDNGPVLLTMLILVDVLINKNSYAEALLYGRWALKGYRKMGSDGVLGVESSLKALVRVCHMDGNYDEEDAYAAILSDFLQLNASKLKSADVTQSHAQRPDSPSPAPNPPVGLQETSQHSSKQQTNISDAEQPLSEISHEDITADQKPGILENTEETNSQDNRDLVTVSSVRRSIVTSSRPGIRKKLIIVGDSGSGKTPLLFIFSQGYFPMGDALTILDEYVADVEVDGTHVELALCDTGGIQDFDRLRPLAYPDSHVILICFAIDNPISLENVQEKWICEVLHFCPKLPIILVGLRKDLRYDPKVIEKLRKTGQKPVTPEEGEEVRKMIGAYKYLECSALTNEGVLKVFQHATRAALLRPKQKKKYKKTGEGMGGLRRLFSRSSS